MELAQHPLNPGAPRLAVGSAEVDLGSAIKKALDLLKASQLLGVQGHDHPHSMT